MGCPAGQTSIHDVNARQLISIGGPTLLGSAMQSGDNVAVMSMLAAI